MFDIAVPPIFAAVEADFHFWIRPKKNPGSFLPGFFVQVVVTRLPSAADAELARHDTLILVVVGA
ncbi:hypothetical protein QIG62_27365, partial [Klebsiella pneumoniae]|nr:hypothetical protein [Klebsiella pneumoniae]